MTSIPETFSVRQLTLLAAAVRVVASGGLRGLTHRAVDAEAGLPQGTCSAYMRTRLILLTWLTAYVTQFFTRDTAELARQIEEHAHQEGYAERETATMLESWLLEPELLLVRMELSLEGTRQPEIARIGREQSEQLALVVARALDTTGRGAEPARARTLIAAVDGLLLHALREPAEDRAAYLRAGLDQLMGTLAEGSHRPTV